MALHKAASVGNSDVVAALIQGGCALDLQNREGNTALHEVSWHGFSRCVKLLVKAGAGVHIKNKSGNTALHLACQNAHAQTARLLLLGGSTALTKNNMGDTCLHMAARYNNVSLVKILLSSLCPVTDRNQVGDTALHVAASLNHKRTVQLLLESGADGTIRNNVGKTALDKARDNNHKEVALLLARASQAHRYTQRTIRKRRDRLTAKRRMQSVSRVQIQLYKLNSDKTDKTTADEVSPHHTQQLYRKTPTVNFSPPSQNKRRIKEYILSKVDRRQSKRDLDGEKTVVCDDGEESFAWNGKAYQLYTLYRDKNGNIRQAPANGCHCKPLLMNLEGQLKVTQEEMRMHVLNIQDQVNIWLNKMERRNRHQIKVWDMLNQERAMAERKNMIYWTEQHIAHESEETLMTQAAVSHELKRCCLSQLNDLNSHVPTKARYYKLLPSPSVEQSVASADPESIPLLSVLSGDSSNSLATYVNILPSESAHSLEGVEHQQLGRRINEMRVDRSPDDYKNATLFHLHAEHSSDLFPCSADPLWQHRGVQDNAIAMLVPVYAEGFSSSSSRSNNDHQRGTSLVQQQEHSCDGRYRKHYRKLRGKSQSEGTRTLEFFSDRPTEHTFSQERNNLHAKEVTQHFFETMTTQLQHWYEMKVSKVELKAQKDKKELLQRISALEEELQRLKSNENEDN